MKLTEMTLDEVNRAWFLKETHEINQLDCHKTTIIIPIGRPVQATMREEYHMYNGLAGEFCNRLNENKLFGSTCVILPLLTDIKTLGDVCLNWIKHGFSKIAIINFDFMTDGEVESCLQGIDAFEEDCKFKVTNCLHEIQFIDCTDRYDDKALKDIWLAIIMYKTLHNVHDYDDCSNYKDGGALLGTLYIELMNQIRSLSDID